MMSLTHQADGLGTVHLPFALAEKYSNAGRDRVWPARRSCAALNLPVLSERRISLPPTFARAK